MNEKMRIGLIGVGMMGKPMARRIMAGGYPLTVHDRRLEPVVELVSEGARKAKTPKEVAEASDIVLTCLPTLTAAEEVYLGINGLLRGARLGMILVETSTVPPSLVRKFAGEAKKQGVIVIDAALRAGGDRPEAAGLKSDEVVAKGLVTLLVGGSRDEVERVKPVLATFASHIVHLGPVGSGVLVKVLNNAITHAEFIVMCETLAVAAKAGVDIKILLETLVMTGTKNRTIEDTIPKLLQAGKGRKMRTEAGVKDTESMLQVGTELGVPLLMHSVTHAYYVWAEASGLKDRPWDEMLRLWEGIIGKPIKFG